MSSMPMASPSMSALMTVAMMVAMMLPSGAPTLACCYRRLSAMRTILFAAGYASVWAAIGLALFALPSPARPPWTTGAVLLCVGGVQRSRWKARQLRLCRPERVTAAGSARAVTALGDGCRFGVDCGLSCAAPMAALFVTGLMDSRMMLLVSAAITAERLSHAGARVAQLTGGLALLAGLVMCVGPL